MNFTELVGGKVTATFEIRQDEGGLIDWIIRDRGGNIVDESDRNFNSVGDAISDLSKEYLGTVAF